MYYVYFLKSQTSERIYIGYSSNLKQRLHEHNAGTQSATKYGIPWKLVYYEAYISEKDARLREKQIKQFKSAFGFLKKRIKDSLGKT